MEPKHNDLAEARSVIHQSLNGLSSIRARIQMIRRRIQGTDGEPATKHLPQLNETDDMTARQAAQLRDRDSQLSND